MKKILISLSVIVAVAAVVAGATTAFYNDSETSSGNVLAAGAIDLAVDNESYYNGHFSPQTSWDLNNDLDKGCRNPDYNPGADDNGEGLDDQPLIPCLFFNFNDLKPGDWEEDTISLHVKDNDSWLCADVTLTKNDDNDVTEPEDDELLELDTPSTDPDSDPWDGELAQHVKWYWWADDGDNVLERCRLVEDQTEETCVGGETLIHSGVSFPSVSQPTTFTVALADANGNIWSGNGPLPGGSTRYIGKAWCFGDADLSDLPVQDGGDQGRNPSQPGMGIDCDGSNENNITQTDSMMLNVSFRAEQERHNGEFVCRPPVLPQ